MEYRNVLLAYANRDLDLNGENITVLRDFDKQKFLIKFKESLVTSTKEFIKNILRKVYE